MELTVVGGGLTGLVAAIEGAEHGWRVRLHEGRSALGGRAGTLDGPFRANRGPHALYADGPLWAWLEARRLVPAVVAPAGEALFRVGGRLHARPAGLGEALGVLPATAPLEESFRGWLRRHVDDPRLVEAVVGLAFIVTYDHDPGRLSAAFVHDRLRRGGHHVRYVEGGWGRLIDQLAVRAADLGVELRRGSPLRSVPDGPTIVATTLAAARRLTGDPRLEWPGTRVALLDLGLRPAAPIGWFRVFDLDQRIYAARYSLTDPSLAPDGHHLLQVAAALPPGEPLAAAMSRVEALLDAAAPGWAGHVRWRRSYELSGATGAVDLPGTSWRDRPAVLRTPTLAVASDQSAAPGLLTEVAHHAARSAVATFRGSVAAPAARSGGPPGRTERAPAPRAS